MPAHPNRKIAQPDPLTEFCRDVEPLSVLSRSPQPYYRQSHELLEPSDRFSLNGTLLRPSTAFPPLSRESTPNSDSGTDADDEHFLKGLPAPRARQHKGLRGRNEVLSGTSTPLASPAPWDERGRTPLYLSNIPKKDSSCGKGTQAKSGVSKRRKEIVRRVSEVLILASLGGTVYANEHVRPILHRWRFEIYAAFASAAVPVLLYPCRLVLWAQRHRSPTRKLPLRIPSAFDPAPLLYPPAITIFVSSLISVDNEAVLLPNVILALSSLPPALFPTVSDNEVCNPIHWLVSCAPLFALGASHSRPNQHYNHGSYHSPSIGLETAVLLYPLHRYLSLTLHALTTTSLLTTELQLLSIALINVLLLSTSPQATILQAMLWVGGLGILVLCSKVIRWGITLARVPKWRFRRASKPSKHSMAFFSTLLTWRRVRHDLFHASLDSSSCSSCEAFDDPDDSDDIGHTPAKVHVLHKTVTLNGAESAGFDGGSVSAMDAASQEPLLNTEVKGHARRHTLPNIGVARKSHTHTPSGRRKRSASSSARAFFSLTSEQAAVRKWVYACYVYLSIVAIVFVPHPLVGVKDFVQVHALRGHEPVGWALGYLLGDLPRFRWEVVSRNLERWICLPSRPQDEQVDSYQYGWIQYLCHSVLGEANTRLLLGAYCLTVIGAGLIVVFRLSPIYEVDTRRKVFHFMMVAMFLPSIYVDPTFAALALSIVLAVFLLLDLLRASQLPPLSKPLALFLAPYVDGRDLRGPVVISHIFLLIGCAIPLWLSLGSLPRTGTGYVEGWEVPTREVSMVAGVICVGLGDAAASLIGRRYGHRKWLWGGGKSLEGSVAFAVAVLLGLLASHTWLRLGGWPATTGPSPWLSTIQKSGACAGMASLTEAVLTGGNDNVIVPVVLWTCVKSLGI